MSFKMDTARRQIIFGAGAATAGVAATALTGVEFFQPARPSLHLRPRAILPIRTATAPPQAPVTAPPPPRIRRVALHNLHTGDKLQAVYWENGKYVPDALAEVQRVMRDWRNGREHFMDPKLFDVMHDLSEKLETKAPFQIISGYRSPDTNAMLHAKSDGVATHSQHMEGKASDIRIEGVQLAHLHKAALSLKAGGVGYYPVSNFVHVDVARVRSWQGA